MGDSPLNQARPRTGAANKMCESVEVYEMKTNVFQNEMSGTTSVLLILKARKYRKKNPNSFIY